MSASTESRVVGKEFGEAVKLLEQDGFSIEYVIEYYAVSSIIINQSSGRCHFTGIVAAFFTSSCSERWYATLPVRDNIVDRLKRDEVWYDYSAYAS